MRAPGCVEVHEDVVVFGCIQEDEATQEARGEEIERGRGERGKKGGVRVSQVIMEIVKHSLSYGSKREAHQYEQAARNPSLVLFRSQAENRCRIKTRKKRGEDR